MSECPTCPLCTVKVRELDVRVDQRFVDLEKRLDERFRASEKAIEKAEAAQGSYNQTHNDLVRKMDTQQKETCSREIFVTFTENTVARFAKLERWPWLGGILFILIQTIFAAWIKFSK